VISLLNMTLNYSNKQKAFTLTELLVVIAVIGLLGSIIFAITSGAGEQGRIAKGLYFSQHLHNSLGSYAAGIWSFDEGSGTTANDISGWGNNGTFYNSPAWRCATANPNYTPSGQGCSLEFNGTNSYVDVGNHASLSFGNNPFTIELWYRPDRNPTNTDQMISKFNTVTNRANYELYYGDFGSNKPGARWTYNNTSWQTLNSNYTTTPGTWYHAVFVHDGTRIYWYMNGQQTNSANSSGTIDSMPSVTTKIGIRYAVGQPFLGLIDEVRIYATSLTSSQIQSRYYAGLNRLLAKGQITQEEHKERVRNI